MTPTRLARALEGKIDDGVQRMIDGGVASPATVVGCTEADISDIEENFGPVVLALVSPLPSPGAA